VSLKPYRDYLETAPGCDYYLGCRKPGFTAKRWWGRDVARRLGATEDSPIACADHRDWLRSALAGKASVQDNLFEEMVTA